MYDVMAIELKIPLIFVSSDLYWYIELSSLPAYDWSTTFCRSDAADKQHNTDTAMQQKHTNNEADCVQRGRISLLSYWNESICGANRSFVV